MHAVSSLHCIVFLSLRNKYKEKSLHIRDWQIAAKTSHGLWVKKGSVTFEGTLGLVAQLSHPALEHLRQDYSCICSNLCAFWFRRHFRITV